MSGPPTKITREAFHEIYLQGEEAVFALFDQLATGFDQVASRVVALEEQVARNSGNSSKPPSSDGLGKKPLEPMTMSLRKKTGKKVGGQPGHCGKTLTQVEQPDEVVVHRLDTCPDCQSNLATALPVSQHCRQVFEMPDPRVVITEHQVVTLTCPGCGKGCTARFPDEVQQEVQQPVQYGPNLLGFATYLHGVHLVPFARCAQIVQDVTGAPFSPGSLDRALQVASTRLEPFEEAVERVLARVPVKHVDETGSRVAGKLHWFTSV